MKRKQKKEETLIECRRKGKPKGVNRRGNCFERKGIEMVLREKKVLLFCCVHVKMDERGFEYGTF